MYEHYGDNVFLRIVARFYLHEQRICGVELPYKAKISAPIRIPHLNSIVVHEKVTILRGVSLLPFCTIGNKNRTDKYEGTVLGKYVSVGSGAKVIGDVIVESFTVIGANAVIVSGVVKKGAYVNEKAKVIRKA